MKDFILRSRICGLVLLAIVHCCSALPGGAPSQACNTFTPRHADRNSAGNLISPQSRNSTPYEIAISRSNFTGNTIVRVWVIDTRADGETGYRGILLQARRSGNFDDGPIGTWEKPPASTKRMTCSRTSDAMTHSEVTTIKDQDTVFRWKAPCANDTGDIVFTATVAQSRERFWINLTSEVVTDLVFSGSGEDEMAMNECSSANGFHFSTVVLILVLPIVFIIN